MTGIPDTMVGLTLIPIPCNKPIPDNFHLRAK